MCIRDSVTTERGELPAGYDRKSLESDKEEYANYSNGVFADWLAGKATDEQLRAVGEREKELTARTNAYFATEAGAADAAEELGKQLEELETRKKELDAEITSLQNRLSGYVGATGKHVSGAKAYIPDDGDYTADNYFADIKAGRVLDEQKVKTLQQELDYLQTCLLYTSKKHYS